jgi:hypothetical protein
MYIKCYILIEKCSLCVANESGSQFLALLYADCTVQLTRHIFGHTVVKIHHDARAFSFIQMKVLCSTSDLC